MDAPNTGYYGQQPTTSQYRSNGEWLNWHTQPNATHNPYSTGMGNQDPMVMAPSLGGDGGQYQQYQFYNPADVMSPPIGGGGGSYQMPNQTMPMASAMGGNGGPYQSQSQRTRMVDPQHLGGSGVSSQQQGHLMRMDPHLGGSGVPSQHQSDLMRMDPRLGGSGVPHHHQNFSMQVTPFMGGNGVPPQHQSNAKLTAQFMGGSGVSPQNQSDGMQGVPPMEGSGVSLQNQRLHTQTARLMGEHGVQYQHHNQPIGHYQTPGPNMEEQRTQATFRHPGGDPMNAMHPKGLHEGSAVRMPQWSANGMPQHQQPMQDMGPPMHYNMHPQRPQTSFSMQSSMPYEQMQARSYSVANPSVELQRQHQAKPPTEPPAEKKTRGRKKKEKEPTQIEMVKNPRQKMHPNQYQMQQQQHPPNPLNTANAQVPAMMGRLPIPPFVYNGVLVPMTSQEQDHYVSCMGKLQRIHLNIQHCSMRGEHQKVAELQEAMKNFNRQFTLWKQLIVQARWNCQQQQQNQPTPRIPAEMPLHHLPNQPSLQQPNSRYPPMNLNELSQHRSAQNTLPPITLPPNRHGEQQNGCRTSNEFIQEGSPPNGLPSTGLPPDAFQLNGIPPSFRQPAMTQPSSSNHSVVQPTVEQPNDEVPFGQPFSEQHRATVGYSVPLQEVPPVGQSCSQAMPDSSSGTNWDEALMDIPYLPPTPRITESEQQSDQQSEQQLEQQPERTVSPAKSEEYDHEKDQNFYPDLLELHLLDPDVARSHEKKLRAAASEASKPVEKVDQSGPSFVMSQPARDSMITPSPEDMMNETRSPWEAIKQASDLELDLLPSKRSETSFYTKPLLLEPGPSSASEESKAMTTDVKSKSPEVSQIVLTPAREPLQEAETTPDKEIENNSNEASLAPQLSDAVTAGTATSKKHGSSSTETSPQNGSERLTPYTPINVKTDKAAETSTKTNLKPILEHSLPQEVSISSAILIAEQSNAALTGSFPECSSKLVAQEQSGRCANEISDVVETQEREAQVEGTVSAGNNDQQQGFHKVDIDFAQWVDDTEKEQGQSTRDKQDESSNDNGRSSSVDQDHQVVEELSSQDNSTSATEVLDNHVVQEADNSHLEQMDSDNSAPLEEAVTHRYQAVDFFGYLSSDNSMDTLTVEQPTNFVVNENLQMERFEIPEFEANDVAPLEAEAVFNEIFAPTPVVAEQEDGGEMAAEVFERLEKVCETPENQEQLTIQQDVAEADMVDVARSPSAMSGLNDDVPEDDGADEKSVKSVSDVEEIVEQEEDSNDDVAEADKVELENLKAPVDVYSDSESNDQPAAKEDEKDADPLSDVSYDEEEQELENNDVAKITNQQPLSPLQVLNETVIGPEDELGQHQQDEDTPEEEQAPESQPPSPLTDLVEEVNNDEHEIDQNLVHKDLVDNDLVDEDPDDKDVVDTDLVDKDVVHEDAFDEVPVDEKHDDDAEDEVELEQQPVNEAANDHIPETDQDDIEERVKGVFDDIYYGFELPPRVPAMVIAEELQSDDDADEDLEREHLEREQQPANEVANDHTLPEADQDDIDERVVGVFEEIDYGFELPPRVPAIVYAEELPNDNDADEDLEREHLEREQQPVNEAANDHTLPEADQDDIEERVKGVFDDIDYGFELPPRVPAMVIAEELQSDDDAEDVEEQQLPVNEVVVDHIVAEANQDDIHNDEAEAEDGELVGEDIQEHQQQLQRAYGVINEYFVHEADQNHIREFVKDDVEENQQEVVLPIAPVVNDVEQLQLENDIVVEERQKPQEEEVVNTVQEEIVVEQPAVISDIQRLSKREIARIPLPLGSPKRAEPVSEHQEKLAHSSINSSKHNPVVRASSWKHEDRVRQSIPRVDQRARRTSSETQLNPHGFPSYLPPNELGILIPYKKIRQQYPNQNDAVFYSINFNEPSVLNNTWTANRFEIVEPTRQQHYDVLEKAPELDALPLQDYVIPVKQNVQLVEQCAPQAELDVVPVQHDDLLVHQDDIPVYQNFLPGHQYAPPVQLDVVPVQHDVLAVHQDDIPVQQAAVLVQPADEPADMEIADADEDHTDLPVTLEELLGHLVDITAPKNPNAADNVEPEVFIEQPLVLEPIEPVQIRDQVLVDTQQGVARDEEVIQDVAAEKNTEDEVQHQEQRAVDQEAPQAVDDIETELIYAVLLERLQGAEPVLHEVADIDTLVVSPEQAVQEAINAPEEEPEHEQIVTMPEYQDAPQSPEADEVEENFAEEAVDAVITVHENFVEAGAKPVTPELDLDTLNAAEEEIVQPETENAALEPEITPVEEAVDSFDDDTKPESPEVSNSENHFATTVNYAANVVESESEPVTNPEIQEMPKSPEAVEPDQQLVQPEEYVEQLATPESDNVTAVSESQDVPNSPAVVKNKQQLAEPEDAKEQLQEETDFVAPISDFQRIPESPEIVEVEKQTEEPEEVVSIAMTLVAKNLESENSSMSVEVVNAEVQSVTVDITVDAIRAKTPIVEPEADESQLLRDSRESLMSPEVTNAEQLHAEPEDVIGKETDDAVLDGQSPDLCDSVKTKDSVPADDEVVTVEPKDHDIAVQEASLVATEPESPVSVHSQPRDGSPEEVTTQVNDADPHLSTPVPVEEFATDVAEVAPASEEAAAASQECLTTPTELETSRTSTLQDTEKEASVSAAPVRPAQEPEIITRVTRFGGTRVPVVPEKRRARKRTAAQANESSEPIVRSVPINVVDPNLEEEAEEHVFVAPPAKKPRGRPKGYKVPKKGKSRETIDEESSNGVLEKEVSTSEVPKKTRSTKRRGFYSMEERKRRRPKTAKLEVTKSASLSNNEEVVVAAVMEIIPDVQVVLPKTLSEDAVIPPDVCETVKNQNRRQKSQRSNKRGSSSGGIRIRRARRDGQGRKRSVQTVDQEQQVDKLSQEAGVQGLQQDASESIGTVEQPVAPQRKRPGRKLGWRKKSGSPVGPVSPMRKSRKRVQRDLSPDVQALEHQELQQEQQEIPPVKADQVEEVVVVEEEEQLIVLDNVVAGNVVEDVESAAIRCSSRKPQTSEGGLIPRVRQSPATRSRTREQGDQMMQDKHEDPVVNPLQQGDELLQEVGTQKLQQDAAESIRTQVLVQLDPSPEVQALVLQESQQEQHETPPVETNRVEEMDEVEIRAVEEEIRVDEDDIQDAEEPILDIVAAENVVENAEPAPIRHYLRRPQDFEGAPNPRVRRMPAPRRRIRQQGDQMMQDEQENHVVDPLQQEGESHEREEPEWYQETAGRYLDANGVLRYVSSGRRVYPMSKTEIDARDEEKRLKKEQKLAELEEKREERLRIREEARRVREEKKEAEKEKRRLKKRTPEERKASAARGQATRRLRKEAKLLEQQQGENQEQPQEVVAGVPDVDEPMFAIPQEPQNQEPEVQDQPQPQEAPQRPEVVRQVIGRVRPRVQQVQPEDDDDDDIKVILHIPSKKPHVEPEVIELED